MTSSLCSSEQQRATRMPNAAYGPKLRDALDQLERLVVEWLRHGFFDLSVACQVVSRGRRELIIRAGKGHKFIIRDEEVPR
jgi:hypothetical protein